MSVEPISVSRITPGDATRAGYASRAELLRELATFRDDGQLYRIELQLAGPDPRAVLREHADLSDDEVAELTRRLARFDAASTHGPWTMETLRAHRALPGDARGRYRREHRSAEGAVQDRRAQAQGARSHREPRGRLPPLAAGPRVPRPDARVTLTTPPMTDWGVCVVDTGLDSRAVTFENPTGARGAGGTAAGGGARARRRGACARASVSCSPTSRARASCATSG